MSSPRPAAQASDPVVYVVDDDASICRALARLLRSAGFAVQTFPSAKAFLDWSAPDRPACLVLDIRMPGPSGLDLQSALREADRLLPIVFITGHGDVATSVRAMKAGAVDFLTKPVKRDVLLAAARAALAHDAATRAHRAELRGLRDRFESLTTREREVFERVVDGRLNKQIADELGTSIRTVKAHRANVMSKMAAGSLAELVGLANRLATPARM